MQSYVLLLKTVSVALLIGKGAGDDPETAR